MLEFVVRDADLPGLVWVYVEKDGDIVAGCRTIYPDAEKLADFLSLGVCYGVAGEKVKFTDLSNVEKKEVRDGF